MAKFRITYSAGTNLGSGSEVLDFESKKDAEECAEGYANESYNVFAGLHGILLGAEGTDTEILEAHPELGGDAAWEAYCIDRAASISYTVKEI